MAAIPLTCLVQLFWGLIFNQALLKDFVLTVLMLHREARWFYFCIIAFRRSVFLRITYGEWYRSRNDIKEERKYWEAWGEMCWAGVPTFWHLRAPTSLLIIHVEQLVNAFLTPCWLNLRPLSWQAVFWVNLTPGSEGNGQPSWRHFCKSTVGCYEQNSPPGGEVGGNGTPLWGARSE